MKFLISLTMFLFALGIYAQEKIEVIHIPITNGVEYQEFNITTNIKNSYLANAIYLNYKLDNGSWKTIEMLPKNGKFSATINGNEIKGDALYYYFTALDLDEKTIDIFKNKNNPQVIKLEKGEKNKFQADNNTQNTTSLNTEKTEEDSEAEFFHDEFEVFIDEDEVKVKLASGKEESLFDSPLSASVLTKEEIKRAGSVSIPEALRLIPGVIVREQTSGNYDIHIRGFDYVPPKAYLPFSTNSATLLMIDNRIIYNYINGGIYWEALPIDINDVERIEIVRGAASAMYGPNAATGVINIITKRFAKKRKENSFLDVNMIKGDTTDITDTKKGDVTGVNAVMGIRRKKLNILLSGNYVERRRPYTKYWGWRNGELDENGNPEGAWVDDASDLKAVDYQDQTMKEADLLDNQFPNQTLALRRYGVNLFTNYDLSKDIKFSLDLGAQYDDAQKAFLETLDSFLSGVRLGSQYANFKTNFWNGEFHLAYKSESEKAYNYPSFSYDSNVLNMILKYDFDLYGLSIRPLLNYNRISYDGKGFGGEKVANATMEDVAASIRFDYTLLKTLRLIAAGRVDKYAHNDKYIFTFQLATTVNIKNIALLRAVYSRANRNPFLSDTFYRVRNLNVDEPRVFIGNTDLDPLTMDMAELGLRLKFGKTASFDLEAFYTTSKNYDDITFTGEIVVIDGVSRAKVGFQNMDLIAKQMGITANLDLNISIVNLKLFATIQKTNIEKYNDSFLMNPNNQDLKDLEHKNTPRFYGGAYLNIKATKNLNFNINPYYYSSQVFMHNLGTIDVDSKFILNAKIEYNLTDKFSLYFDGRNILNNKSREFGYADEIGGLYLIGANINY